MGSQMSRTNRPRISGLHHPQPPPPSAKPPARTSEAPRNSSAADLNSYESMCRSDPHLLTSPAAINSITVGLDVRSLLVGGTQCRLEMKPGVLKIILQDKKGIWKNQELLDLVEDYFKNNRLMLDLCTDLDSCLKRAGHVKSIIKAALRKFEEEHCTVSEEGTSVKNYSKTLEELRNFRAAIPFTQEFFEVFDSVQAKQKSMLDRLQLKKRKLDRKLRKLKAWKRVSNVIFVATFAAVLICSVVAVAVSAPPVVGALAAAAAVPLGSIGKWLNSLWKKRERDPGGQRKITGSMEIGTLFVQENLANIRALVDRFQIKMKELLANADFAVSKEEEERVLIAEEEEERVVIAVEEIRKKVDDFIKTVRELTEHANNCSQEFMIARTTILQMIMNHRSSSNQDDIGFLGS